MNEIHDQLKLLFETYLTESYKFEEKGIKVSALNARNALLEISKLCKERRAEIQEKKKEL